MKVPKFISGFFFIPIYLIVMDFIKNYTGYNERYDFQRGVVIEDFPKVGWIENNVVLLAQLNLLALLFVLFILSPVIKKWRGISEE